VTNPTSSHDGDGEQTAGPGVAAGYTSFDNPAWVSSEQGGNARGAFVSGQATWSFTDETLAYDSEHQRVSMSGTSSMTYYFNDPVSRMKSEYGVPASGAPRWRDHLVADGRMVAERTIVTGGSPTIQYFVADPLRSIAVSANARRCLRRGRLRAKTGAHAYLKSSRRRSGRPGPLRMRHRALRADAGGGRARA